MICEGYHTVPCVEPGECEGCVFVDNKHCSRPRTFPKGCSSLPGYIWVKDAPQEGTISVKIHFDTDAFKSDVMQYVGNMDMTKYINVNQGT